jgi:GntR family transcriptional repressor for pyruvate dehydrogenase complex
MRELLDDVFAGQVAPGERLQREVDLKDRFKVSRGVVRECLRGLEERGIVRVKHGVGATVNDPYDWDVLDPEVIDAMLQSPHAEALEAEASECQRLLEVEAAGLAAERRQGEDLDALNDALERMDAAAERAAQVPAAVDRFYEADIDFHRAVVRAAGNRAIGRTSEPLHRALAVAARRRGGDSALEDAITAHRRILTAVEAGNADDARKAMAAHLADAGA